MPNRTYYIRDRFAMLRRLEPSQWLDTPIYAELAAKRGTPVAVIISTIDRENDCIKYAVATTHKEDHFQKKMGRKIALGRLNKQPLVIQGVPDKGHLITKKIMTDIVEKQTVNHRTRKLAEHWLLNADLPRE